MTQKGCIYAPKWVTSLAAYLDVPIGNSGSIFSNVNWAWRDDHNTGSNLAPAKEQKAYSLWNGQLGWRSTDARFEAFLWCRNCFDKDYKVVVFDSVLQPLGLSSFLAPQRQWGGTIRTNF